MPRSVDSDNIVREQRHQVASQTPGVSSGRSPGERLAKRLLARRHGLGHGHRQGHRRASMPTSRGHGRLFGGARELDRVGGQSSSHFSSSAPTKKVDRPSDLIYIYHSIWMDKLLVNKSGNPVWEQQNKMNLNINLI